MDDSKQRSYLTDAPQGLANSCDTLLLLDDGTKLPAHAAILARLSGVFCGMLDEGPLTIASRDSMVVVPVNECTEDVAKRLLSIIYTFNYRKYITESSAFPLASLGHKLDVKGLVEWCDEHLSEVAGFAADVQDIPLQSRSPEFILQTMKTAERLRMPKILACCERHVAIDFAKSMRTQAFWEQIPACSSVRIAKGLYAAYEKLHANSSSSRKNNHTQAASEMNAHTELKFFVPPCKAFLKMAELVPS